MLSLSLAGVLPFAIIAAAGGETYSEAHKTAMETGRPIVVNFWHSG